MGARRALRPTKGGLRCNGSSDGAVAAQSLPPAAAADQILCKSAGVWVWGVQNIQEERGK